MKNFAKILTKKIGKCLLIVVLGFAAFSLAQVTYFKYVNPSYTYLMLKRKLTTNGHYTIQKQWKNLNEISPELVRAVIASEDNLFIQHKGFSLDGIENAVKERKEGRVKHGGSTISQQTAKNMFTTCSRTYTRKAFEVYYTFLIEKIWGKRRIMEIYLNVIEMGDGIWGAEAASQTFYHHSAAKLSRRESAMIAACLPNPNKMKLSAPTSYMRKRQAQITKIMGQIGYLGEVE